METLTLYCVTYRDNVQSFFLNEAEAWEEADRTAVSVQPITLTTSDLEEMLR